MTLDSGGATVAELREGLLDRRLSAAGLVESALAGIERSDAGDAPLNAFLAVAGDDLLEEAAAVDRALDAGAETPPLAGIPVAVKDNICTLGLPTTCGSRILSGYRSPYEATAVRRLRAAGALVIGKTNLDEFAMGSSTENSAFGPTRNPHASDRVPGGSSGGSAAAVAADLVPVALGSDTGGSIRQPASFCGVVGLKPTYGRVSRYGLVAFGSSLDQIGPMARCVSDVAQLLEVMAGPDARDSTGHPEEASDYSGALDEGIDGLVVGIAPEFFPDDLDDGIAGLCRDAADRLGSVGAEVREISLPHVPHGISAYYLVANAEASSNLARYDGVRYGHRASDVRDPEEVYRRTRGAGFGPEVKRRIVMGTYALSAGYYDEYYGRAQRVRRLISAEFARAFESGVDLIFTPTTPSVAFRLGERLDDPLSMYLSDVFTVPASLAGLPAISLPVGAIGGLPVGAQLIGGPFEERTLLTAARALEAALDAGGAG